MLNPPGPVSYLTKEELDEEGYQSTYTHMYNLLREKGWIREDGKYWVLPKDGRKYKRIDDAYKHQLFLMELNRK